MSAPTLSNRQTLSSPADWESNQLPPWLALRYQRVFLKRFNLAVLAAFGILQETKKALPDYFSAD